MFPIRRNLRDRARLRYANRGGILLAAFVCDAAMRAMRGKFRCAALTHVIH